MLGLNHVNHLEQCLANVRKPSLLFIISMQLQVGPKYIFIASTEKLQLFEMISVLISIS